MIVKRNRPPKRALPRMIVRRGGEVGARHKEEAQPRTRRGVYQTGSSDSSDFDDGSRWRWLTDFRLRRREMAAIIAASAFVILLGGGYALWASPVFQIQHIKVEGSAVSEELIVGQAHLNGQSIFTADFAQAQANILKIPQLGSVRVEREWPNTVHIIAVDRQPWGVWKQGALVYIIDRQGVVLSTDIDAATPDLPVIRASGNTPWRVGDHLNYQAVDAAAELYAILPQRLGLNVSEVAFVPGSGVQVSTSDGQIALFGDSSSIAYKVATWQAIQKAAKAEHINYGTVDLRFGNRPVVQ